MENLVLYTAKAGIAEILINRPEKRNALSPELVSALIENIEIAENDTDIRIILFKGTSKAFSAGADLAYLQTLQNNTFEENLADSSALAQLFKNIHQSSKITIAQVEGPALAGGCGLATICDFIFATPSATFGYTEVRIGFIPAIVSYFLLRKIGEGKAKSLLLTGDIISAEKAQEWGIINEIIAENEINTYVQEFCNRLITQASGEAIKLTKQLIDVLQDKIWDENITLTATFNAKARATNDCKRGIQAFLNKEKIVWK